MFEKESKFIIDYNLNKIRHLGGNITFEKLAGSGVHPAIIKFISAELDKLIYEDRNKLLQQSVFDYSGNTIAGLFNSIAVEVKNKKRLNFEELKNYFAQAVSFNLSFIFRPQWALTKLVFNGKQTATIEEIENYLNYLYYYDYFRSVLSRYSESKNIILFTSFDFETLISKIDKEITKAQPEDVFELFLNSAIDMLGLSGQSKFKIPLNQVESFLKEKELLDYIFRIRKVSQGSQSISLSGDDLRKIIYSKIPVTPDRLESISVLQEEPEIIEPIEDISEVNDFTEEIENSEAAEEPDVIENDNADEYEIADDVDLEKYEEELKTLEDAFSDEDQGNEDEEINEEEEGMEEEEEFEDEENEEELEDEEEPETKDISEFESLLTSKEKKGIIKNVFENDEADYRATIEKIIECNSYEDATQILKSVFFTYRVRPYDSDPVKLTNAVEKFFGRE